MSEDNNKLVVRPTRVVRIPKETTFDSIIQNPDSGLKILKTLAEGASTGVQTEGDALMLLSAAKELGIGLSSAMRNINIIKGKVTLSYHILKAMLDRQRHEISYDKIADYEPVYMYITQDNIQMRGDMLPKNAVIVDMKKLRTMPASGNLNIAILPQVVDGKLTSNPIIIDYYSKYKFQRLVPNLEEPDTMKVKTVYGQYYFSQCQKEGLYTEGGNWSKRPRVMVNKSAFIDGAREIAADIIQGMYADFEFSTRVDNDYEIIPDSE